mgnify:CR=1 FL=1
MKLRNDHSKLCDDHLKPRNDYLKPRNGYLKSTARDGNAGDGNRLDRETSPNAASRIIIPISAGGHGNRPQGGQVPGEPLCALNALL